MYFYLDAQPHRLYIQFQKLKQVIQGGSKMYKEWIKLNGIKKTAIQCDVTYEAARRWAAGEKKPSRRNATKLIVLSEGQIKPADFFDLAG